MSTLDIVNKNSMASSIAKGRNWLIAMGVILIIVGTLAIIFPFVTSLSVAIIIGISLVFAGVAQAFQSFSYPKWSGLLLALFVGILWAVAGIYMLARPLEAVFVLTILLAAAFVVEGIAKIVFSFRLKPIAGWGWMLFNGIMATAVGLLLWLQLPLSATWALGLLVGLNIALSGWSIIMIAQLVSKFVSSDAEQAAKV